ncbi:hypothetical protein FRC19_010002 [Serendipita sp. 401]|nr:hypothetical protein FRC15_006807 [Serendipita sp. 397]KAG8802937.1 hypothetical protein FRC16_008267 [Serendipita sp. 398]KAG8825998.1 hypothetical protein FRC19_010002 [Serendipita sp. 401]KAG9056646.1 hypothetical protein FS842_010017 [Serendipita sp. 407]
MDDLPIGRYGTIHYMSNNGSEIPIASYPIDEVTINLGRSDHNTCHIRLLDLWCSDVHCKVIFEEGKAFLIVLGENGVIVDGSNFLPSEDEEVPTTIPLTNGSEWLISKRRFIFQYPPKDQRAKLLATPMPKSRKSLRMSMVTSAQLWTPTAQSGDLADRLRSLRSPVKPFHEKKDYQVTLVEGDPLHFAQSTEEVVVVERVEAKLDQEVPKKPSQTPRKPRQSTLHKQVLLMNSHRKQAPEVDESDEEKEVEAFILSDEDSDEDLEEDAAANPFITKSRLKSKNSADTSNDSSMDKPLTAKSFRESLGALGSIRPFGRPSGVINSPHPQEKAPASATEPYQEDELAGGSSKTPLKQNLGSFLTPQVNRTDPTGQPRQSVGGSALRYTHLDEDLEAARRRLANLGPVSRPQVVTFGPDDVFNERPTARSTKKPRTSLAEIPDFSSPLPPYKSASKKPAMTPIAEPSSSPIKPINEEMEENEEDDSAMRLQRLMRTVERATHRESIRESRKSIAVPDDFWSASSPTKQNSSGVLNSSIEISARSFSLNGQSLLPTREDSEAMSIDMDNDVSQKGSLFSTLKSGATSMAVGPTTSAKRRVADTIQEDMEIDRSRSLNSSTSSHPGEGEQMSSGPKKRRTKQTAKKAHDVPVGNVVGSSRGKNNALEEMQVASHEESVDSDVPEIEEPTHSNEPEPDAPTRARRGRTAKVPSTSASTATSTSTRKIGRPKAATATAMKAEDDEPSISNTEVNVAEAATSQKTRTRKAASKKVTPESASKQEAEDTQGEPSMTAPATKKRATRSRATPAVEESVEQTEELEQSTVKGTRRTATKKTATAKKGQTTDGDEVEMETEPTVEKLKAKTATRGSKRTKDNATVKDEPEEEIATETKPKRTARTKR